MQLTYKQVQILLTIGNFEEKKPLTKREILERLPYKTTRQSFRFSLNALYAKGLIRKTPVAEVNPNAVIKGSRGQGHRANYITLTPLAMHIINGDDQIRSFVFSEKDDAFLEELKNYVPPVGQEGF